MNRRKSNIAVSTLCSCAATGLNLIIGMMFIPLITNRLGSEAYGYVSLANTIVTYAGLITMALNSYAVRYVSLAYHGGDIEQAEKYYSSVVLASIAVSLLILAAGIALVPNISTFFKIPFELLADVKILFAVTTVNFCIQTVSASFLPSSYLADRLELYNGARILSYILEILAVLLFFRRREAHMWYVSIAFVAASATVLICNILIFRRFTGQFHIKKRYFSLAAVKKLLGAGIWNSINGLGNILNSGLDLWISNLMLDAAATGYIAIAKTVGNVGVVLQSAVSQVFWPKLIEIYAANDKEALVNKFRQIMKCTGLFVGIFFCVFTAVGDEFYALWMPGQEIGLLYELTVIVLMSNVMEGVVGPLYYIYTLTVKNRIPCMVTIAGGVVNVAGMYLLLTYTKLGAFGIVITTAVIMGFINLVTNPLYMARCLKIKRSAFYGTILRYAIYIAATAAALRCAHCFLWKAPSGWIKLGLEVCAGCCYCIILYGIIVLDKKERNRCMAYVRGRLKKR